MSIESTADWKGLREVRRVTRLVLDAVETHVRAGVTTGELDRVAAALLRVAVSRAVRRQGFSVVRAWPGTAWAGRFTSRRPCPTSSTPGSETS